jgi:signal transduction histidine kinase
VLIVILLWLYLRKISKLNRALEASNQVRDTLFSIIGHDLKGPVGNASQMADLMKTEDFSEAELRSMLAELGKQTTVAFDLLNALFEWGSAQLKGVKVSPEDTTTKSFINKNISLLGSQAALKNITINDHTSADTLIFADPNHFDFIIRNLLSNAIKFTFNGGRIDINAQQGNDDEIIFSVKDTGKGISPEQQEAFLKTNLKVSFGTGGEKGSGLGLLLIKEFIQANKGHIWLESKENEGSTFYFSFPLKKG